MDLNREVFEADWQLRDATENEYPWQRIQAARARYVDALTALADHVTMMVEAGLAPIRISRRFVAEMEELGSLGDLDPDLFAMDEEP